MSQGELSDRDTLTRLESTLVLLERQVESRFLDSQLSTTLLIQTSLRPQLRTVQDDRVRSHIDRLLPFIDQMDVHAEPPMLQKYRQLLLKSLTMLRSQLK